MRTILVICLLLSTFIGNAQELEYKSIDWEAEPVKTVLDTIYNNEQQIILKNRRIVEFIYSDEYDNNLVEYFTIHKKIHVISDDAVQYNNKLYISMNNVLELVEAKARVITPEGKVIDFDESNIMESEGGDGRHANKYFAIDGVVNHSDVEYTYTVLKVPYYNGTRMDFQDEFITRDVDIELYSPENLIFEFKSYNGFPKVEQDTTIQEKNAYKAHADTIPGMVNEDYNAFDRNLQSLVYKLERNTVIRKGNLVSFGTVAQDVYAAYYQDIDKGSRKSLKKFVNDSGASKGASDEEKVRIIENYIKNNISIVEEAGPASLSEIISNKYGSPKGLSYLMINSLKQLGIKHELVLTGNRYEDIFDKDFEHYQVLKNLIIYIPSIKMYLAPDNEVYRLGIVPSDWMNQHGLFIKEVSVGEMQAGLGKVKYIKPLDYTKTQDNMNINIVFDDMAEPTIEFTRELLGYSCVYFQGIYDLIQEEGRKELDESIVKFSDEQGELIQYNVSGTSPEDVGVNPMVYNGKLKSSTLMERAGNKFLFKIGEVIGPQMEMYQEKERQNDIVHDHNMIYNRKITFDVPDGYKIVGLEDTKINETYPEDKPIMAFISNYTIDGNHVTITIEERYEEMFFEKSEIDDFRRIINAAANFNKVVVLLEKRDQ